MATDGIEYPETYNVNTADHVALTAYLKSRRCQTFTIGQLEMIPATRLLATLPVHNDKGELVSLALNEKNGEIKLLVAKPISSNTPFKKFMKALPIDVTSDKRRMRFNVVTELKIDDRNPAEIDRYSFIGMNLLKAKGLALQSEPTDRLAL